jgi:hypothetical protein
MRLSLLSTLILIAMAQCSAGEGAPTDVTVQAAGLRIVSELPAGVEDKLRSFNWTTGTTVTLLITSPAGGFVQFDHKNSAISKFTDDKETDLLAKPKASKAASTSGFSLFPNVAADGKACSVEVCGPSTPVKGATSLKLEGVLTMLCAANKKEFEQKDVPLKSGSKITADKTELMIEKVGKPEWGNEDKQREQLSVTLRSHNSELDEVAEIRFFKTNGTEIEARRMGTSKMGILGAMTVDWDYILSEKADAATVKVYLWTDLQKKKVPFSLNLDVGL